ncbi:CCT chaperonin gamma subunit [Besnoitia besnoiti]|uniref:T-complex protein 1 subunit gamma n=1 Tax=Besnoitia besnoiti TaxID=94643 RepID=A0A2A9MKI8_BESBE|nr:CCT chaperonin gamma subunit [Besnoitia besnoiti]PFH35950.1 CCT chaperonin gamma subunit [Besnoitia besnoiti]
MIRPQGPVLVLKQNTKREQGRKAQLANIQASKAIADIVRTTLGPSSMLKMLLDPLGGIVLTNDGNAILREVDVLHPAAKTMIELSRTQDEEVGDGSTSVVVLAGEVLAGAVDLLEKQQLHPSVISHGYMLALDDTLKFMREIAVDVDVNDNAKLREVVDACLNTKFSSRWEGRISEMAIQAVRSVEIKLPNGKKEIDIKRYAKVEKIPGGDLEESRVLDGVLVNKDVTHAKMRRYIANPKVLLLDCPLEYKKGESQTYVEITKEDEWAKLLEQEEKEVRAMCDDIIASGCNLVITEKGVSDLAQHFLVKAGISCIRRVRKTDNNRIARVTGATIVNRTEEITKEDVGTKCGLFEIKKIGDEYFMFLTKCEEKGACTILLRGGSKDVLNEVERNLQDAMNVARNIMLEGKLLPGGGAVEMAVSARLLANAKNVESVRQYPYKAVATALEVIPRTLAQNCGTNVVKVMTELRAKHATCAADSVHWGVDGETGAIVDMAKEQVWDSLAVKQQIVKTAIEAAAMLLRIDDVLSGVRKEGQGGTCDNMDADPETFGDSRDG